MSTRFWLSCLVAAVIAGAVLSGAGWAIAHLAAPPPPERFVSSTFQFDLPRAWTCVREGTETVCRSDSSPKSAICILTMKYRGDGDTVEAYMEHLSTPIATAVRNETGGKSEVIRVGRREIKGYTWVTGLHYESEVPGYYTEYFTVLTSHIAVLVTFSAHKDSVEQHRREFETMISSLKVHQQL